MMKIVSKIAVLTTLFSIAFYYLDLHISENDLHIDHSHEHELTQKDSTKLVEIDYSKYEFKSAKKSEIYYAGKNYRETLDEKYKNIVEVITKWKNLQDKFKTLIVRLEKKAWTARWKMKNKTVRIYAWHTLWISEFTSVFIHELGHYIDIYYLTPSLKDDPSNDFYKISWKWEKVLKAWEKTDNFVSWYAMTNRYEDFAESFTFFVLHNKEFYKKAWENQTLRKKYDFFEEVLFKSSFFKFTSFSSNNQYSSYFRDTTKQNIDTKKFLNYIKND